MTSPFPAVLRPAARSAFRAVLRSARITFQGDEPRRTALTAAVRQTFSSPSLTTPGPSSSSASSSTTPLATEAQSTSEEELRQRIEEWRDVALFLRRNVVQGEQDTSGAFKLRVTPDTELGDNHSIKNPPKLPTTPFPNRNKRRKTPSCGTAATST